MPNPEKQDKLDTTTGTSHIMDEAVAANHSEGDEGDQSAVDSEKADIKPALEADPNIVDWDSPDDPSNPLNFSTSFKVTNVGIISALTFVTPLASSMFAPGVPMLLEEFNSSNAVLADFVVSVYVLGFAIGPLLLAPLSELYGRLIIYHICNVGFIVFSVACAVSPNLGALVVLRFFQGCFGSAPVNNGGGTIADIVPQGKRGGAIAVYTLGPLLGPVIGPVAGGYLAAGRGWRWVFWVLAIIGGGFSLLSLAFLRETYPPVLLRRKTQRLIKETGNTNLKPKGASRLKPKQLFYRAILRPARALIFSPIVFTTSIYTGIVYGYQYIMFSTFTFIFEEQYGFPTNSVGLTFLGFGIGALLGLFVVGFASDRLLKAKTKTGPDGPSSMMTPEVRLWPLVIAAFFIPVGLFLYGWSAQYKYHWIVPEIGTALVGIGSIAVIMCIISYLVDAFTIYAASALAVNTVVRSILGALLPLAGQSFLLGFIAVACIPKWRKSFDVSKW
ncbi:putative MFS multidrug transporter [Nemania abortiva]|nr:putative MFS multidrug transporter [Nemania abortiva]